MYRIGWKNDVSSLVDLTRRLQQIDDEAASDLAHLIMAWQADDRLLEELFLEAHRILDGARVPSTRKLWAGFESYFTNEVTGEPANGRFSVCGLEHRLERVKNLEELNVLYRKVNLPEIRLNAINRIWFRIQHVIYNL